MLSGASDVLTASDVDRIVSSLRPIDITEVGQPHWKQQREEVEQLNLQAHNNVARKRDEFVYEAFHSHEKLGVLVHELLVIVAWKRHVWPLMGKEVDRLPTAAYMFLHYESVLTNLLECVLYNPDAAVQLGDIATELTDYCYGKLVWLNSIPEDKRRAEKWDKEEVLKMSDGEHQSRSEWQTAFRTAITCISIMWGIIQGLPELHVSVVHSVMIQRDMLLQFTALLGNAPWVRRGDDGTWEKFKDGEWVLTKPVNLLDLLPYEAHAWLGVHMLVCDQMCRSKYKWDGYRKDQLMRLRRYLNDRLVDQLPPLGDLRRAIEEMNFADPPHTVADDFKAALLVDAMPQMQMSITEGRDWPAIAAEQRAYLTSPETIQDDVQRMANLIDAMYPDPEDGAAAPVIESSS